MVFDISRVKKEPTVIRTPPQIIIYGANGVGKSTICAPSDYGIGAPNPIYMNVNNRIRHLAVVGNDMPIESIEDCEDFLDFVANGEHEFKTLVIDTADDLERLIFKDVAEKAGKSVISDIGYSKGYDDALDKWHEILKKLSFIRDKKRMIIVVLAQEDVKKQKNADGDDYEYIVPKLHGSTTKGDASLALFTAWADCVFRLKYNVATTQDKSGFVDKKASPKFKAVAHTGLFLFTKNNPAFRAKDTYNLPERIDASMNAWQNMIGGINQYWNDKMPKKIEITSSAEELKSEEKEQPINNVAEE